MSFPIGTDLYVKFKNITRLDTGAAITSFDSTTIRFLTTAGVEVSGTSVSGSQVGSTNAVDGVIPDTGTANLTSGTQYDLEVVLVESGSSYKRTIRKRDTANYD